MYISKQDSPHPPNALRYGTNHNASGGKAIAIPLPAKSGFDAVYADGMRTGGARAEKVRRQPIGRLTESKISIQASRSTNSSSCCET